MILHADPTNVPSCTPNQLRHKQALVLLGMVILALWWFTAPAAAQPGPQVPAEPNPVAPVTPLPGETGGPAGAPTPGASALAGLDAEGDDGATGSLDLNIDFGGGAPGEVPSRSVVIILGLTVLALAPTLLILLTSFTRMVVVLSLTRNALGVQTIPPNQVVVGLALFLSLFVMAPTLSQVNEQALQPYLNGEMSQSEALKEAEGPIKGFMLANTRSGELDTMMRLRGDERPERAEDTSLVTLIPAFVLSELKAAFIIGIVIFVPFLVIDLVVAAGLMSLGMMMLPPVFVSLPLKMLLFVMVDGWTLIVEALVSNYQGFTPI